MPYSHEDALALQLLQLIVRVNVKLICEFLGQCVCTLVLVLQIRRRVMRRNGISMQTRDCNLDVIHDRGEPLLSKFRKYGEAKEE